ncbi:MAG: large-conductance mechanosensitive channel protein MscL [Erysipelothrix sp.]|nr:large-conductance mechanosensitive channel protein MscL [Erysipelothrix sp.]
MKFMKEFKEFISKGNVMDLAVGVIIGGAFGKIITSLVNDVLMPLIGIILGGNRIDNLNILLKNTGNPETDVVLRYGAFLQNIIDFLIIAFAIFILIKTINKMKRQKTVEETEVEPVISEEVLLLREIRDHLKK